MAVRPPFLHSFTVFFTYESHHTKGELWNYPMKAAALTFAPNLPYRIKLNKHYKLVDSLTYLKSNKTRMTTSISIEAF